MGGVVLPDVYAVGLDRVHKVGTIVDDQQRLVLVTQARVAAAGGDDLLVEAVLGAQLHDVDAAVQRALDEVAGDHIAYEVQAGMLQAGASVIHACECGRRRPLGSECLREPHLRAERADKPESADRKNLTG